MTTLSLTAGQAPRDRLDLIGLASLLGLVAAVQLSIAVAQIFLTVAALCWFTGHVVRRERLEAPAFFWPLVGYAALTLLAAGYSGDPVASVIDSKQLVLFLLVPVVFEFARGARARTVLTVIITIGALSALVGLVQYAILNYGSDRRLQGTLSHWMTYSGTLMLVICAATGRLLFDPRDRGWAAVVMPALVAALMLSFTRSAMVGAAAGVGVLLLLRDFRLVGLLPIVAAVVIAVSPAPLTDRIYSAFDMNDPTSRDRVAMLEAGAAMIKDHPLTGVGPEMVGRAYPHYRVATAVQEHNLHLHNVPMQIAAERGLPALAMWIWFVVAAVMGLRPLLDRSRHRALAAVAMGAVAAMLTAGMFEYNFGDSEFLMLFLILLTLPFAADRDGGLPS
ncbi:MAG TPA: O-antigen ligase family protein [Vicinamibacterales bacterium]|nr:O-antigen ligase family protein [Vicinamibacterales bacterium]